MIQSVQKFQTEDGKVFDTEAEAQLHSSVIANAAIVDAFLDRHYPVSDGSPKQGPSRSISRKAIFKWLADQAA